MPACSCPNCGSMLQFEAASCQTCGHAVRFDPDSDSFVYLPLSKKEWLYADGGTFDGLPCANTRLGVCNWMTRRTEHPLCRSCRHNRIIPALGVPGVLDRWRKVEEAKRRLTHELIRLRLPLNPLPAAGALVFDLLYDPLAESGVGSQVLTGHEGGVITLNLIEADDAARERTRTAMGEPYRTLLGHFRHEIAHHYWHRLVEGSPDLGRFRLIFGDERSDYAAALQEHYRRASVPDSWSESFISAYAASHPWEDFAETFAHYLHIVDTLGTAADLRTSIQRPNDTAVHVDFNPYTADAATLITCWIPFASSFNAINRSMGLPDLYPFSVTPAVAVKLDFVIRLVAFAAARWMPGDAEAADLKAMAAALTPGLDHS